MFDRRPKHVMQVLYVVLLAAVLASAQVSAAQKLTVIGPFSTWGPELGQALTQFPAITVIVVETIDGGTWVTLMDKVVTMVAAGVPPDLIYADAVRAGEFAERGLLLNLERFTAGSGFTTSRYPQAVADNLLLDGKLFMLPTALSNSGLFYNTDLLAANGIEEPPTDWNSTKFNWDDFVAIAKKLTKDNNGDKKNDLYGIQSFGVNGSFNMIGLWGLRDTDPGRQRFLGAEPAVIQALTEMARLTLEHDVVGGNFQNGTAAMFPVQVYYLTRFQQAAAQGKDIPWKVGVLPKAKVRVSPGDFMWLGIPANVKHSAAAWQLLRYLAYDREGTMLFSRAENRVPVTPEASYDFIQRWNDIFPGRNISTFISAVSVLWQYRLTAGIGGNEIQSLRNDAWKRVVAREISIADAVLQMAPQINALLKR